MQQPVNLKDLGSCYLEARSPFLKWSTTDHVRCIWDWFIEVVGDLPLTEVSEDTLEAFRSKLATRINANTQRSYLKALSQVFSWAARKRMIKESPFKWYEMPRPIKTTISVFKEDEVSDLMAAINRFASGPRKQREVGRIFKSMTLAAWTSGIRLGEGLNLTIRDVDLEQKIIRIQPKAETEATWAWSPKDLDPRTVPLVPQLTRIVEEIIAELPPGQPYLHLPADRYEYLQWLRSDGRMSERMKLTPWDNYDDIFRRLINRSGLKGKTYHDLRRTCCTDLCKEGMAVEDVAKILGHASVQTTERYYLYVDSESSLNHARQLATARLTRGDWT